MQPTALIIEDAEEFVVLGRKLLEREGFRVAAARTGEDGVARAREIDPDLVLIDLTLPGMDGFEVCRRIREFTDAYVVVVTGRTDEVEKVVAFRLGADDYVIKPYSPAELGARIGALRRRPRHRPDADRLRVFGSLEIDVDAYAVSLGGKRLDLTKIEFALLEALTERPRRAISRDQLLRRVWGSSTYIDTHVLDVHIANLRRKIGDSARTDRWVQTVRGLGYRFEPAAA